MEGSSVECHSSQLDKDNANQIDMAFHSHFSDLSHQGACTAHSHMEVLTTVSLTNIKALMTRGWMLDSADGCSKQCRCANALCLLSVLAAEFNIVVDRAAGAPGHGKSKIDGLNAVDKRHLQSWLHVHDGCS